MLTEEMDPAAPVRPNVFDPACPSRIVLGRVSGKWAMLVIDTLADGPVRNGALLRRVGGISQKMLSETLTTLADLGLVSRHSRATVPPHVEYSLTPLGQELHARVYALDRWIEDNLFEMMPECRS